MLNVEAKVGAMIIAGILALGLLFFTVNDWSFAKQNYALAAHFKKADGLRVGAPVCVAGVHVGKIKDVQLTKKGVLMILEIQEKVQIPQGSRFTIASSGMLGDKYIEITPNYDNDKLLKPGSEVTGSTMTDMNQVITEAVATMVEVQKLTTSFNNIVGAADFQKAAQDSMSNLAETLVNMNKLVAVLQELAVSNQGQIQTIIGDISVMSRNIASASGEINRLMRDVEADGMTAAKIQQILSNLDTATAQAALIAKDVQELTGDKQLKSDIKSTVEKANKTLSAFEKTKLKFSLEGQSSSTEHKLKTTANVYLYPNEKNFLLFGITNKEDSNKLNLQVGENLTDRLSLKVGFFQSALGVALNQYLGEQFSLEGQLTTKDDAHFNMKARYHFNPDLAFTYQQNNILGGGEKEFNLGLETKF